ncbi:MAG: cupin domain-containing protein [Pirellulales bacterium]
MSKMKLKRTLAGVLVACAFGGIALRFAWATPGQGIFITPISGPAVLDEINTKSETDDHEVELKTRGLSDVYVAHIRVVPGGHGGWHFHPGPSIISVKSGTATFYQADDPATPHVFPAGTGFVEDAGLVHILVNEGDIDVELIVLQLVPLGAPRRIDAPAP